MGKATHLLVKLQSGAFVLILLLCVQQVFAFAQSAANRRISGVIVDPKGDVLNGLTVIARGNDVERRTTTNETGQFDLDVPFQEITLQVEGQYIRSHEQRISTDIFSEDLRIEVEYL